MKLGIDKFSGIWVSEVNYKIEIIKIDNTSAVVSIYNPKGIPINRPYFDDKPTIKMPASYDDYNGDFTVDLWKNKSGFELDIIYEAEYELDQFKRESIIPAISRYEEDYYLDQYYGLFGDLKHFTKICVNP